MGTDEDESYPSERPSVNHFVERFYIDETEVTNSQFYEFVEATGYVTLAEQKPNWKEMKKQLPPRIPKPNDSLLTAGSLVFFQPDNPVNTDDISIWWK